MYECATCDDEFYYRDDCDEHMDDYDHWIECEMCTRQFRSQRAASQHMDALDHWRPRVPCETCSRTFASDHAANSHMRALGHYRNYCKPCDRHFNNENNFRMHLNSRIHRPRDILCPFCKAEFVTASGVSHHLESGACSSAPRMNRETILRMVRNCDPGGMITNRQIEWYGEANMQYEATDYAFNGRFWECYLCHREFNQRKPLDQHLNSPAHQQKVYHCPNRRAQCSKEFVTLAALFNHLESETCSFIRFEKVQQVQRQLTDSILNQKLLAQW